MAKPILELGHKRLPIHRTNYLSKWTLGFSFETPTYSLQAVWQSQGHCSSDWIHCSIAGLWHNLWHTFLESVPWLLQWVAYSDGGGGLSTFPLFSCRITLSLWFWQHDSGHSDSERSSIEFRGTKGQSTHEISDISSWTDASFYSGATAMQGHVLDGGKGILAFTSMWFSCWKLLLWSSCLTSKTPLWPF